MVLSLRAAYRKTGLKKVWQTLSSIKTGVILIILVVIFSAAGTVILQRPITEPEDLQRAYSPDMLRFLDATGLTDIFHTRWFVALMVLVSLSIIAASVERFPNAWRYFARPYKSPDEGFRRVLPTQAQIPVADEELGLSAAERALRHLGLKSERIVRTESFSLFSERNRISEMAVYIVHASLLLIFLGGIVDALYGWRGFLMLTPGSASNQIELRNGGTRTIPFSVRCDATGEDTYPDGTPKRWWSKLAVVDGGREVSNKEIVVNDPLVYEGLRFYQASWGRTGKLDQLTLNAAPANGTKGTAQQITLAMNQTVTLDADTTVQLVEFIPDFVVQDGHVYARSKDMSNPAVHMIVTSKKANSSVNVWLPEIPGIDQNASSPYAFDPKDLKTGLYTGLQVSHEPGQWAVWAGVVLMAIGLTFVFYVVHMRFWVVPVSDARGGLVLWVGGTSNRNRDAFEHKFKQVVEQIQKELKPQFVASAQNATSIVGR
ncbi:MAG TPA: cytochrome c biogenesis protein ResB [Candidatus Sulfotelmatobacter sp.]|jgi:cytochrome c biogenesis protein|nr:cytochrome c biogenesis protein ResB [Candidatus Sulfotelmatobacter sp.]